MYQFRDIHAAGAAAIISRDAVFQRQIIARGFGRRSEARRSVAPDLDLVVDLGVRIASRQWLRGAATCALLCYGAWSLAPEARAMPGAAPAPTPERHRAEAQALAIAPLALGADTGKRMAPADAAQPLAQAPERPTVSLVVTLGEADGLVRLLQRSGVSAAEAAEVAAMIGAHVPIEQIRPGTVFNLTLGRRADTADPRPLETLTFRARLDLRLTIVRAGAQLVLEPTAIAIDETPLRIQGRVGASLYRSARAAGAPARVVEAYIRAIATQVNVGQIGAGDLFDIVVENRRAASGESESGRLLFAGLSRAGGREIRLMQWSVAGGEAQWFEASGVGRVTAGLTQPVPGRITSGFGYRTHPILGYRRFHRGLDIGAGHGTPILATTDGVVARAGWGGGYGNVVELRHGGGLATRYGHMSRIAVAGGQRVRQGQVIGYVGSTGLSTGPHLHYEMFRNGELVDPRSVRWVSRSQLSGADLEGFRSRMRSLMALPTGAAHDSNRRPIAQRR
ncbi:MAG TPA: peptidoglycan DD-metalloendopeptidase family protein [Allosphingosinicella sp.]